jgi:hypothetical protein
MRWTVLVLALISVACGPSSRNDDDNFGGGDGGHGSNGSGGSGDDGCSAASKLIYVVDSNNTLSQFDPSAKAFHDLGTLSCPVPTTDPQFGFPLMYQPFSMGVDRNATAYVLYVDQSGFSTKPLVFKVDTTGAGLPCSATSFTAPSTLVEFGMGFSTTTAGGDVDQLFIGGSADPTASGNATLYNLDVTNYAVSPALGGVDGSPELTGNANAELWGFFPSGASTQAHIEQINKTNGTAISSSMLPANMQGQAAAWAFGFYGGDYWVFLQKMTDSNTSVYEVSPTGTLMTTTPAPGRKIVGAGVSTCAPVVIE